MYCVRGVTLLNESMIPNKLKRRLEPNRNQVSKKSFDHFICLLWLQKKKLAFMKKRLYISYVFF